MIKKIKMLVCFNSKVEEYFQFSSDSENNLSSLAIRCVHTGPQVCNENFNMGCIKILKINRSIDGLVSDI